MRLNVISIGGSVTRLGDFLILLVKKLHTKVAQKD